MLRDIISFAGLLREAGISVAASEIIDFARAVKLLGTGPGEFYSALEATIIKSEADRPLVEEIFQLFWLDRTRDMLPGKVPFDPGEVSRRKYTREEFDKKMEAFKNSINRGKLTAAGSASRGMQCGAGAGRPGASDSRQLAPPEELAKNIIEGQHQRLVGTVVRAMEKMPDSDTLLPYNQFLSKLKQILGWHQAEDTLNNIPGCGQGSVCEINLQVLDPIIRRELERVRRRQAGGLWAADIAARHNIKNILFSQLDKEQERKIQSRLVLLGRRLATRPGYRRVPAKHGIVDLRNTLRRAGPTGFVPLKLCFLSRQNTRPELLILCDLSGSVLPFSKFMLLLVHAMHAKFNLVKTFAFVERAEEVTSFLQGRDIDMAVDNIFRHTGIWREGFTDYGSMWQHFAENYLEELNRKTTLLVLGDARNNYKPDGLDYFKNIASSPGRVLWLNPSPRHLWGKEDCIIEKYAPHCRQVFECRNLSQLEMVARKVF